MPACSIMKCGGRKNKNQLQLTLHRFPRNERLRKQWLEAIGEENINPRHKEWYIRSLHFEENCFNRTLNVIRLHNNSVPTVFPVNARGGETSTSEPSNKKRKRNDDSESDENDSDCEDEYDEWAKECAIELRQMAPDQEVLAKAAIRYILMEGRNGRLHEHSVYINEIPLQTTQEEEKENNTESQLDEFLVIRKSVGSNSVARSPKDTAASGSSQAPVDPGTSSVTGSHNTVKTLRVMSKSLGKAGVTSTVKACRETTTSSLPSSSSLDDTSTSFVIGSHKTVTSVVVGSHKTATSIVSSPPLVKTEPLDDVGSSSVIAYEVSATLDASSSIVVTAEPCDGTLPRSLPASHERDSERDPLSASPPQVKSEPNSPPSSPDFTVVFKEEPE